ncbi:hypothetical protein QCM80_16410 [Bradyrhizobium sp. SSUT112]|nr:hypothetical protein [Bradyrhizobium sp. SSUT112]MDH2352222.1 hypothetical protein [Bradyrhizobium sp. SSUT112]
MLSIIPFDTEEETIGIANESKYGVGSESGRRACRVRCVSSGRSTQERFG